MAKLYMSGAVTLSAPGRWAELLWPGIDGIEAGHLTPEDLDALPALVAEHGLEWGVHSPLSREGIKYLFGDDHGLSRAMDAQIRQEWAAAAPRGARYLLVHFPWFAADNGTAAFVRAGRDHLFRIQAEVGAPLLFEPKLGARQHPGAIALLHELGPAALAGARLCLDLGDWWLASERMGIPCSELIRPFLPLAASLHVHHVWVSGDKYTWVPIHPSTESRFGFLPIIREALSLHPDLTIVFEHTPHLAGTEGYAREGVQWLRDAISS